jgi:hypothetical protein
VAANSGIASTQKNPNPTLSTLIRLAAALGYRVELVREVGRGAPVAASRWLRDIEGSERSAVRAPGQH